MNINHDDEAALAQALASAVADDNPLARPGDVLDLMALAEQVMHERADE